MILKNDFTCYKIENMKFRVKKILKILFQDEQIGTINFRIVSLSTDTHAISATTAFTSLS